MHKSSSFGRAAAVAVASAAFASLVVSGCAKGRTPPDLSRMVRVEANAGDKVEFVFGNETQCSDGEEGSFCSLNQPPMTYPDMTVRIDPFQIDEHEVTNLQYQHCVAKGVCSKPKVVNALGGGAFDKYYDEEDSRFDDFPVVNVTWLQARDYCNFAGKRLPTEFEWEAAAKLATVPSGKRFPWGDSLADCKTEGIKVAVAGCSADNGFPQKTAGAMTDDVLLVNGRELSGMFGNVSEWVETEYDEAVTCQDDLNGCTNAYQACEGESGSSFAKCAAKWEQCDVCREDPSDDTSPVKPMCYGSCLATLDPIWICQRYEEPVTDPVVNGDGARVFRGGSYTSRNLCDIRPDGRIGKRMGQSDTQPWVGFRCAK